MLFFLGFQKIMATIENNQLDLILEQYKINLASIPFIGKLTAIREMKTKSFFFLFLINS